VRECKRETETQTISDGRREWRAEWAASSYFENRAGLTGHRERGLFGIERAALARTPSRRDSGVGTSCVSEKTVAWTVKMAPRVRWIRNTRVPTWARVRGITCCIPCVLFAERAEHAERVSGTLRARQLQARCAFDVIGGNLAARMPDKQRTSHVENPPRASAE